MRDNPIYSFAHSESILNPMVNAYGCGWFDGGCFIFARALQLWLGGELAVLMRPELVDEQAFDHVVVRVHDHGTSVYIDADGPATRTTLLSRWRTRERLNGVRLEDPAQRIRFVGHLYKDSFSEWIAEQLRRRFGNGMTIIRGRK